MRLVHITCPGPVLRLPSFEQAARRRRARTIGLTPTPRPRPASATHGRKTIAYPNPPHPPLWADVL